MRRALKAWFGHWSLPVAVAAQTAMGAGGLILHLHAAGSREEPWDPSPSPLLLALPLVLGWRLRDLTAADSIALVPGLARTHTLLLGLVLLPLATAMTALPFLLGDAAPFPTWALAVSLTSLATCVASGRWPALTLPVMVAAVVLLGQKATPAAWVDLGLLLGAPIFTALLLREVARRPCPESGRLWQRIERAIDAQFDRMAGWFQPRWDAPGGDPVRRAWRHGFAQGGGWTGLAIGTPVTALVVGLPACVSGYVEPRLAAIGWAFAGLIAFLQAQGWALVPDPRHPAAAGWNRSLAAQLHLLPGDRQTGAALMVAGATANGLAAALQVALGIVLGLLAALAAGRDWIGPALVLLLPATLLGSLALGALPALMLTCRGWWRGTACAALAIVLLLVPAWLCAWRTPGCLAALLLLALAALLLPPLARHRLGEAELP